MNYIYAFAVMKVIKRTGESAILHWIAHFFPSTSTYFINKYKKTERTNIMKIEKNEVSSSIPSKYTYLSTPLHSTNITFEIRIITPEDAGYYAGEATDRGVVLIVIGEELLFVDFFFCYC